MDFTPVLDALETLRIADVPEESDLHALIARAFQARGLDFEHEAVLGPGKRVDFLVDGIAIEVKKGKPVKSRLLTQLKGYLQSEKVHGIIVVAQQRVLLPQTLNGKPIKCVVLNRLWGIAL